MTAPEAGSEIRADRQPVAAACDGTRRLWSLWEMINCNLKGLVELLRRIREEHALMSAKKQTREHIRRDDSVANHASVWDYTVTHAEVGRLCEILKDGAQLCGEHGL